MNNKQNPNLQMLQAAAEQLGELVNDIVFLGGMSTGLLVTDPAAPPLRITKDVDAVVEVLSHTEFHQLEEKLRRQGFSEDMSEAAPICRWVSDDVVLDIMPTDESILGFGSQWYLPAFRHSQSVTLPTGECIRHVSAPYFLITKLEAFEGRGNGDFIMSHDIEDIVAIFDGRPTLLEEVLQADEALVSVLAKKFSKLLLSRAFLDAVSAHLPPDDVSQSRVQRIIQAMQIISQQGEQQS